MPSIVSIALRRNSASPVASVNVRSSKIRSPRLQAVLLRDHVVDATARSPACAPPSWPCPTSSIVNATTAAPCSTTCGTTASMRSSPVLEVDRVDDGAARIALERRFHHVRLGRVDHQRRLHALCQQLDDRGHLVAFILPLRQRHTHIEQMRASLRPGGARRAGCPRSHRPAAAASRRASPDVFTRSPISVGGGSWCSAVGRHGAGRTRYRGHIAAAAAHGPARAPRPRACAPASCRSSHPRWRRRSS